MMIPHNMSGQRIGLLGLGRSGIAAARSLAAAGAVTYAYDDKAQKDIPSGCNADNFIWQEWQEWPWNELDSVVISPGIPHLHPEPHPAAAKATKLGIPIISEVELALRAKSDAKLIAITGTNGKSTCTALLGHCLVEAGAKVVVGGNIGEAACSLQDPGGNGYIILELSSYQLETTPSLAPDFGVVLNITPDHLDRHGGMAGYVAAKKLMVSATRTGGHVILGSDDIYVRDFATASVAKKVTVKTVTESDAPKGRNASPALSGAHNAQNAAAMAVILRIIGYEESIIDAGMATFAGLPHRLQPVGQTGSISFINDSKATNGVAAAKALMAFDNIYWIAGGLAKDDGVGEAGKALGAVKKAYLIGASATLFASQLAGKCTAEIHHDLNSATNAAFADAQSANDIAHILLSPAAASFDQFDSFEARGDAFTALAASLCARPANCVGGNYA
ncbi:UDP-N-acetylmuramoyl-L-alanine--D-glutamate ligase [Alphaproteobacteria bacterium]|nr:UDP-N-acetylmuramoyl-L-alanine--D-glutamate ligase [Alphaproteobacteria bacterium]